ncbi:MAG: hypothetical protein PHX79_08095, partial [Sphaerochaetaceae bacterium]|nr:hypothetical protein [Sphaerochaetaceae bacterium]
MSRIYAPVDEPTLEQIDQDAKEKGISRAQWVSTAIESILHQEGGNIENLRLELEQARTEREETWRELVQLRRTQEQSSTDIEQLRSKLTKLQEDKSLLEADLARCKEELERCKVERDKITETMRVKDDVVAFLRGHIAQLTQSISQLSLKPGEEEIKKK